MNDNHGIPLALDGQPVLVNENIVAIGHAAVAHANEAIAIGNEWNN